MDTKKTLFDSLFVFAVQIHSTVRQPQKETRQKGGGQEQEEVEGAEGGGGEGQRRERVHGGVHQLSEGQR